MSDDIEQHVDTNSAQFKQGVEAGLHSADDTKNWKAVNELGQELKDEGDKKGEVYEPSGNEPSPPLFVKDREDNLGNLQDEKDESEE